MNIGQGGQHAIPCTERSARQAAAARLGPTGKLRAKVAQRDPSGLFDQPAPPEPTLFDE